MKHGTFFLQLKIRYFSRSCPILVLFYNTLITTWVWQKKKRKKRKRKKKKKKKKRTYTSRMTLKVAAIKARSSWSVAFTESWHVPPEEKKDRRVWLVHKRRNNFRQSEDLLEFFFFPSLSLPTPLMVSFQSYLNLSYSSSCLLEICWILLGRTQYLYFPKLISKSCRISNE